MEALYMVKASTIPPAARPSPNATITHAHTQDAAPPAKSLLLASYSQVKDSITLATAPSVTDTALDGKVTETRTLT